MRWIDLIKRSWINIKLKKKRNLRIIISITIGVFSVFMMLTLTMNIKERINFLASDYDKYREIVIQAPLTAKNSSDFKEETDSITGSYSNAVKELDIDSTNELLNSYKNNLEDGYKLYNMNWNLGYIDNFIVRTNTMAVSKNRLKTIKNEKGALVSRSFLNNIITAENYSKGRPMKEEIDVLGKTVSFDIKYSITDHKGNSKKTSKKAEFIIEGILENDDYLFDIPANYDTEVEKESPWNYNASMIYLPAEYIDSLYSSITIDDSSLFQLLHKDIAYGKVVLKASHPKNIPSIIRDLSLKGYDVTGNYWEAALYNGIKLTVALILGGIGFIIILVASVGVVNIMIMAVMERKREIQILKILGGNDKDINKLFLLEGGILGLLGGFIGIALSLLTINIINLIIEDFHIHINPYTIALILIISPVIALTAALPAVKIASREKAA